MEMEKDFKEFESLCERYIKNRDLLGFFCRSYQKEDGKVALKVDKIPQQYSVAANALIEELCGQFFRYVVRYLAVNFSVSKDDAEEKKKQIGALLDNSKIVLLNTLLQKDFSALNQKLKECAGKLQLQYNLNHLKLDGDGNWVNWDETNLSVPTDPILSGMDAILMGLAE